MAVVISTSFLVQLVDVASIVFQNMCFTNHGVRPVLANLIFEICCKATAHHPLRLETCLKRPDSVFGYGDRL
jgi:hypothetical protein